MKIYGLILIICAGSVFQSCRERIQNNGSPFTGVVSENGAGVLSPVQIHDRELVASGSCGESLLFLSLYPDVCCYFTLPTAGFARLIASSSLQLVDVRTAGEYAGGTIPYALNIDVKQAGFLQRADSLLRRDVPVAVFSKGGVRSKKSAKSLTERHYTVYNLAKGFDAWKTAQLPVAK